MKSNEEFIEGIYSKRNDLIKKRKKRNSVIATVACAVICVVAVAGAVGAKSPEKVEELYNDIRKFGSFVKDEEVINADRSEEETTTAFAEESEYYLLIESYTKLTKPAAENDGDKIQNEGSVKKPIVEVLTGVVTEAIEGVVDGETEIAPEIPDSGEDSAAPAVSQPEKKPMPSTEEIVEAAYNALSEEEQQKLNKDDAIATVKRYADGTQIFSAHFTVVDRGDPSKALHIEVQLDSDLNVIHMIRS